MFTDNENVDTEITIENIERLLHISESREYILYIKGYDAIRIPSDKGLDDDVRFNPGMSRGVPKKLEKILSPFIKINDTTYDCRTDKLYDYISKLNGKPIDEIRICYDRFVTDCQAKGIKFQKYVFK